MIARMETSPLTSVAQLLARLNDPQLLLLDCRFDLTDPLAGLRAWQAGHIPGARFASMDQDLAAPRHPGSGRHPLPAPEHFAATLGRWGFTSTSRVVAYDQSNGAGAARLWWMLRSLAHRDVSVLDGGIAAWVAAGGPVDARVPEVEATTVPARRFSGVMTSDELQHALEADQVTLVDARSADRFAGRNETIDAVPGHIPGALNQPFTDNLGADQHWLPATELRRRWHAVLQRPDHAPVVAMCGSGITACHNLLALELAGHHGALLYAGSYSEWIADPSRPVATGE